MSKRISAFMIVFVICWKGVFSLPVFAQGQKQFPFLGQITADAVNIRAGQDVNFETVGQLQKGEAVVVVERSYDWYKIKLPLHAKIYIFAKYVRVLRDSVGEVTGNRVNVRARADLNSAFLGQLTKGTKVRILSAKNDWYEIEPPDKSYGWVLTKFVAFQTQQIPSARVVELPTRNIYVKAREEREKKAAEEAKKREEQAKLKREATGVVVDLGEAAVSADIRHQLLSNGQPVFYLKGYRRVIDTFLNKEVKVEGQLQPNIKAGYPVILVTKIQLIL